ncbi:hypothetical protein [Brevibacillus nitrificans]|uniref:hypothetical protein n=1 Tax=Brevibacillus nitrificans TaxID=651560 RepID=UPI002604E470|nr:hypothetical protein [Brevibacillus nitrificans]
MSKHAQFTAVVKKMATDDKKVVVNLEMVGKLDPYAMANIVDMVGDKVVVNLGNPQMAMYFDEDEREDRRLSVTTDRSGVVTSVTVQEAEDNSDDENSHDEEQAISDDEAAAEGEGAEPDTPTTDSESDGDEFAIFNENAEEEEDDSLPVFGETAEESQVSQAEESEPKDQVSDVTNDKEALENFILSGQAPVFDDITFDFPTLLSRRRSGETWIKIAASINISSTKLQAAWSKYKKLVAEHMAKQNGEEPGAA